MERCMDCGRLFESRRDDEDETCPACGGNLIEVRVAIGSLLAPPPTSGEELTGRLLGIGA